MNVFVDTSAMYALVDQGDAHHAAAAATLVDLARSGVELVTHEYAIVETIALLQRRIGVHAVRELVSKVLPVLRVEWVTREAHGSARDALLSADRRGVSLVDWTSFLLMRGARIQRAFTFDGDFAAQGFRVIPT